MLLLFLKSYLSGTLLDDGKPIPDLQLFVLDCPLHRVSVDEFDEGKALGAAGRLISDQVHALYFSEVLLKESS